MLFKLNITQTVVQKVTVYVRTRVLIASCWNPYRTESSEVRIKGVDRLRLNSLPLWTWLQKFSCSSFFEYYVALKLRQIAYFKQLKTQHLQIGNIKLHRCLSAL